MTTFYQWLPLALVAVAALLAIVAGAGMVVLARRDGSGPSGDGDH